jgi:putative hydrolase of the HAD superfamily
MLATVTPHANAMTSVNPKPRPPQRKAHRLSLDDGINRHPPRAMTRRTPAYRLTQMQIRNVIFDFGGVLVRWQPREIIESFYQDEGLRRLVQERVFEHADWVDWDRGTLSDDAAVERFAARMQRPVGEMRRLMDHVRQSLDALDESHELVRSLSTRGVPLYALSNMSRSTFAHLKARHTVFEYFRGIVISAEIQLVKPDPRIFEHISRQFGLDPAETVFIDDHLPNVETARALGFRTIHFSHATRCSSELRALGIESGSGTL